jgi:hypothetical protein
MDIAYLYHAQTKSHFRKAQENSAAFPFVSGQQSGSTSFFLVSCSVPVGVDEDVGSMLWDCGQKDVDRDATGSYVDTLFERARKNDR